MSKQSQFGQNDVEVIECKTTFKGYFRIDAYRLRHRLFAGGWGEEISREIFERGHAVAVLPYDPVRDEVVLIEQFRAGALAAQKSPWFTDDASPWMIEGVAGIIEAGEQPEDVARREAVEETGCAVTDLMPVCHYLVSPGGTSETAFVFVGHTDTADVGGIHGIDAEGEDIRPFVENLEEAYAGIESGRINNAMTIIALQWLMLNRERVCAAWT